MAIIFANDCIEVMATISAVDFIGKDTITINARYPDLYQHIESTEPKKQNFERFQNSNFKRRGQ